MERQQLPRARPHPLWLQVRSFTLTGRKLMLDPTLVNFALRTAAGERAILHPSPLSLPKERHSLSNNQPAFPTPIPMQPISYLHHTARPSSYSSSHPGSQPGTSSSSLMCHCPPPPLLPTYLPTYLSVCLSVYLPTYLAIYLPAMSGMQESCRTGRYARGALAGRHCTRQLLRLA